MDGFDASAQGLTGPAAGKVQNGGVTDSTLTLGGSTVGRTFSGVISKGTGTGDIAIVKDGAYRQTFTGANTYGLGTAINAGRLQISGATAAAGTGAIQILNDASGTLEVNNGATVANDITLNGRSGNTPAHIENVGATNTLSGIITLADGASADPDYYNILSTSGTLNVTGPVTASGANDTAYLGILGAGNTVVDGNVDLGSVSQGAALYSDADGDVTVNGSVNMSGLDIAQIGSVGTGDFTLNGAVDMSGSGDALLLSLSSGKMTVGSTLDMTNATGGAVIQNAGAGEIALDGVVAMTGSPVGSSGIGNFGAGKIVVNGTLTDVPLVVSSDGLVEIGNGAQINGATTLRTEDNGTIDANAVVGGFTLGSGQTIDGSGTMIGDYVIAGGAAVTVGIDNTIEDLSFVGDLTFAANSVLNITIDLTGTPTTDFLDVDGILSIAGLAQVSFDILNGPLTSQPYVFARYNGLSGGFGGLIPAGYIIDYNYNGNNEIALVMRPVPVPAPLALIGLGALALARTRRYAQR